MVLPAALVLGMAVHIWRVRKDGGIYLPPLEDLPRGADAGMDAGPATTTAPPGPSKPAAREENPSRAAPAADGGGPT